MPSAAHHRAPPATVDAREVVGSERLDDAAHAGLGQRQAHGSAVDERHAVLAGGDEDGVAAENGAAALGACGPVQDRAAREVPAALHQRDPGEHLERAGPRPHRRVRAHEPAGVHRRQQDLGIEGVAPLHRRAVHVRMAGRDRAQAARRAHRVERRVVHERRRIPQNVARVRGHQQPPLAHADIGLAGDPGQAGLDLANHRVAAVSGELRHRRPALTGGRDPLALVLAQRAVLRRCGGRRVVGAAGGADPDRGCAHPFSLPSPAGRRRPEQAPRGRHAAVATPQGRGVRAAPVPAGEVVARRRAPVGHPEVGERRSARSRRSSGAAGCRRRRRAAPRSTAQAASA